MGDGSVLRELSLRSFGGGYQTILFTAGLFALVASILCWNLIRAEDTAVAVRGSEEPHRWNEPPRSNHAVPQIGGLAMRA